MPLQKDVQASAPGSPADKKAGDSKEHLYKEAAFWTSIVQTASGVVGLVGLSLTVLFAGFAWKEAKAAAEAAKASLAHSKQVTAKQLRAYLAVYPMGVTQLIGGIEALGQVRVHNVGQTPARDVTVIVHAAFGKRGREDFLVKDADQSDRSIQPGADLLQGSRDRLDVGEIMSSASTYVFVWGEVRYRDIDGGPHFTRFVHRYHAASRNKGFAWQTPPKKARWIIDADKARYHTHGNDSD